MQPDRIKITILVDNQAKAGLIAEHGFALWIETADRRILFDTGQGRVCEKNGATLGIDLATTDALVLSHGHYDHTGGIPRCLNLAGKAELYCHPGAVLPRYSVRDNMARSLQMPRESMRAIDTLPAERVHWVQHSLLLNETIGLTGPIPRETDFEDTGGPFFLDPKGQRPDPLDDDLALWIRTGQGLIVCVGCAHSGLINTLHHIQRLNGGIRIRAVIGGFHLLNAGRHRLDRTVSTLRQFAPDSLIPCHCTGKEAANAFQNALGTNRCRPGAAGMSCSFAHSSPHIEYG